jgi:hypothetical protein
VEFRDYVMSCSLVDVYRNFEETSVKSYKTTWSFILEHNNPASVKTSNPRTMWASTFSLSATTKNVQNRFISQHFRTSSKQMHTLQWALIKQHTEHINKAGFEVLAAVVTKSPTFWVMASCTLLKASQRIGDTRRLHLQGRKNNPSKKDRLTLNGLHDVIPEDRTLNIVTWSPNAGIVKWEETSTARQLLGKHVSATTPNNGTIV